MADSGVGSDAVSGGLFVLARALATTNNFATRFAFSTVATGNSSVRNRRQHALVGYVQRTIIGPEDTLSDIARRFDVGYEELTLANPGVDPWRPGVGREVIVPTQFILPAAPRDGLVANLPAMRIFYYLPRKAGERQVVYTFRDKRTQDADIKRAIAIASNWK